MLFYSLPQFGGRTGDKRREAMVLEKFLEQENNVRVVINYENLLALLKQYIVIG